MSGNRAAQREYCAFVRHTLEMRRSPAWRHLPDGARRVLDRLELEHMDNGGAENGRLVCTYTNFVEAGIRRASIALAIRQCIALGFVHTMNPGRRAIAEFRSPAMYRLTYVLNRKTGAKAQDEPTNEWRRVKTDDDAYMALARAEAARSHETQSRRLLSVAAE